MSVTDLIAIDTSAGTRVALLHGPQVVARDTLADPRGHVEHLTPMLAPLVTRGFQAVAVGTGPAPFTGLRVGIVTGRALAHARGVPVVGVASLDVLARQALDAQLGELVTVVTDARRKEVYTATYRSAGADVERVTALDVRAPADVDVPAGSVLVGAGCQLYPHLLPGHNLELDVAVLGRLALLRWGQDQPTEPLYLRRPDVQQPGARKRASD